MMTIFFLGMSHGVFAQEDLVVNLPDKIIWEQGAGCTVKADITNQGSNSVYGIRVSIDADDYVDNVLKLTVGKLNPGETKKLCVSSLFNEFIYDWTGATELNVFINVLFKGSMGRKAQDFTLPVVLSQSEGMAMTGPKQGPTTISVSKQDELFSESGPAFSMVRGMRPSGKIATYLASLPSKNDKIPPQSKDRVRITGRILSLFGSPVPWVRVSQKGVDCEVQTDRNGIYTIDALPGNVELIFTKDGSYQQGGLNLDCRVPTTVTAKDTIIVPWAEKDTMFYVPKNNKPIVVMPNLPFRIQGELTRSVISLKSMGSVTSEETHPEFVFLPARGIKREKPLLDRLGYLDVKPYQGVFGLQTCTIRGFVPIKAHLPTIIDEIHGGQAFRIKPRKELTPGNYSFSNTLHVKQLLDLPGEPSERYCYAFVHRNFKDIRLFSKNSTPAPVVISGVIKHINEDGSVVADISLENVARTWYMVTLDPACRHPELPDSFEYVFMMGPPEDGESATYVTLNNLKMAKGASLSFTVTRSDPTAVLFTCLDMVMRGLAGERLTEEALYDVELGAKIIAEVIDDLDLHLAILIKAVRDHDLKVIHEKLTSISGFLTKAIIDLGQNEVKNFAMTEARKRTVKGILKSMSTAVEALMVTENFKLMGELAGFTYDAPLTGTCSIQAR